jgi:hypothetical protein
MRRAMKCFSCQAVNPKTALRVECASCLTVNCPKDKFCGGCGVNLARLALARRDRQRNWLGSRMVDRQEPCRNCWARCFCGGGHDKVVHRGRPACDYIHGWLDYALGAYVRLSLLRPDMFDNKGVGCRPRAVAVVGR